MTWRWTIVFKKAAAKWWADNAMRLSAALSYYTVFSLAPLLVVATGVAGLLFTQQTVEQELLDQVQALVGPEGASAVKTILDRAHKPKTSIIMTVVSVAAMVVFATGVFAELQDALNIIWRIPVLERSWTNVLKGRFLSFMLVVGIGFLLIVSLILSTVVSALGKFFVGLLPASEIAMFVFNEGVSFVVFAALFAALYKMLPDAQVAWSDVWQGATVTAGLFTIGKSAIGLYLGTSGVASAFGAASSLAVILLWVYYSALIFFFGAEFTYVFANEYGSRSDTVVARPVNTASPAPESRGLPWPATVLDRAVYWAAAAAVMVKAIRRSLAAKKP